MESREVRQVAFVCVRCGEAIGDPMYRGPAGHAPADVCFTCWVNAFEQPPWHWPREVLALWLLANGFTRREAVRASGMPWSSLTRLLAELQKNSGKLDGILESVSEICTIRRLRDGRRGR